VVGDSPWLDAIDPAANAAQRMLTDDDTYFSYVLVVE